METIELKCSRCGVYFRRRSSYHRYLVEKRRITVPFCSLACKNAGQVQHDYSHLRARYERGETIAVLAQELGVNPESVRKQLLRLGVVIRHRSAHLAGGRNPTRDKGHSPEAVRKIKAANHRQFNDPAARALASHNQRKAMAEGRISCVSKIEDAVAIEFDRLGISYQRQVGIQDPGTGRFCACVDFLLPNRVVVEVNGTYYHVDPRFYPDGPQHESQRHSLELYAKKTEALARLGYRLVEIWEAEIRDDVTAAVAAALV